MQNWRQIDWGVQNESITKIGVLPLTTLFFWTFCFILETSYKKLILCTNYPNDRVCTLCKRWSFIWECFFLESILKLGKIYKRSLSYYTVLCYLTRLFYNPFDATDLFWYPLQTLKHLWFSDVFRGYQKRSVAWNGLISSSRRAIDKHKSNNRIKHSIILKWQKKIIKLNFEMNSRIKTMKFFSKTIKTSEKSIETSKLN